MELGEALGTVAALEQERLALGHAGELLGEHPRLAREDERREGGEPRRGGIERGGIGIVGKLARLGGLPAVGGPFGHGVVSGAIGQEPVGMMGDAIGGDLIDGGTGGALAMLLPALNGGAGRAIPGAEGGTGKAALFAEPADLVAGERRHATRLTPGE